MVGMGSVGTFVRDGAAGFNLQGYQGGYRYCSRYKGLTPSSESSMDACKNKCFLSGCWALTYYAGSGSPFARQCYMFMSEEECGTLVNYKDTGGKPWSESIGEYSSVQKHYTASSKVVWPGQTMNLPVDYASDSVNPFFRTCPEGLSNCTKTHMCAHV